LHGRGQLQTAVVGGGLLGLEAARHLRTPQLESLTIIEALPHLLPRHLDEQAERYEKYVLFQGVLFGCILLGSKENLAFVNAHSGKEVSEEQLRLRLW